MLTLTLRRLLALLPILAGLTVLVFLMMALIPGDPATAILGAYATPENVARLNRELGLDRPLVTQYLVWLGNLADGDLGRSVSLERPVAAEVFGRLGPTALLAGTALLLASILGMVLGAWAAVRQFGWADRLVTLAVQVGLSMPAFWLGLLLVALFAVTLRWLPASGMLAVYGGGGLLDLAAHLALPAVTLAVVATGVIARLTRTAMLEVLRQDYIRTARAKGVAEGRIVRRHAFRAAIVTVIPVVATQAGFVLGGAVYVETVFQWPGLGRMLVEAIAARDILLVQGGVLVLATAFVAVNLLADLVQAALDPRIAR
ncbi:ABC transporter permease [Marinibaculum pumilum]|uniref:ABC transporter permease n=1 Tax=Marinibaculum pumilum TaxID=1766165 RepID=A0ABV7L216_9PROT